MGLLQAQNPALNIPEKNKVRFAISRCLTGRMMFLFRFSTS